MSLVIFSNSEYSFLWPIIEESVSKINLNKIFVCDVNNLEKPKGFDKYITYNINNCYAKRWTIDIIPNIESDYILIVHDVQIIVNIDTEFILKNLELMKEYNIDRCSLNVFNGNVMINKNDIVLCNLNSAIGNTFTPYDVCPAIWNKKSFNFLFDKFSNETYRSSELNKNLQTYCRNNLKCYGQQKTNEKIYYCLGRPYLKSFKILFITIQNEILNPLDVYMDMKEECIYYLNKYNLFYLINKQNDYTFILTNFKKI
jgi:hypothetical protein